MKNIFIFFLLIGLTLSGCNSSKKQVALSPAPTSNEALVLALDALHHRDKNAMAALVAGGVEYQDFFVSVIETFIAFDNFKTKFIKTYGDEKWISFMTPLKLGDNRPDMSMDMPDFEQFKRDASKWKANSSNKGVYDSLPNLPLPFTSMDTGWCIDGYKVFSDDSVLSDYTNTQRKLTQFTKNYIKAIGHPSVTPEDIDYQMGKDLLILMWGGEFQVNGKPAFQNRFDVNEL